MAALQLTSCFRNDHQMKQRLYSFLMSYSIDVMPSQVFCNFLLGKYIVSSKLLV